MKHIELISRTVYSIDALAKAKGIKQRHEIDTLVGIAVRELNDGKSEAQAYEAARLAAVRMKTADVAINQLLNSVMQHGSPLVNVMQAL